MKRPSCTPRTILILGVFTLVVGVSLVGAWFLLGASRTPQSTPADDIAFIARKAGLSFPMKASLRHFDEGHDSIDASFVAAIEMPANTGEQVVASIRQMPDESMSVGRSKPLPAWWCPNPAEKDIERQFLRNGGYLHIVVSHGQGKVIIYVEWSS